MNIFRDLFSLFYPELCDGCENPLLANEKMVCLRCLSSLPKTHYEKIAGNPVEKIFWGRVQVERASSFLFFRKKGIVQNLIHNIKYRNRKQTALFLGKLYAADLAGSLGKIDMVLPVPLHPKKHRKRGYNQSEWFAKGIADSTGANLSTGNLVRIKNTDTQTHKTREERWKNVSGNFNVLNPDAIRNKSLLLVDDVLTTGATLEACTQALLNLNCNAKVSIATIAYAESL